MISFEYKPSINKVATFEKKSVYKPKKLFWFTLSIVAILLIVASFLNIEQFWSSFGEQGDQINELFSGLFDWSKIDFTTKNLRGINFGDEVTNTLRDTIFNAFAGTILGSFFTIPLAILAATNVIKHRWINYSVKAVLAIFRTLPIFLIALILLWFFPAAGNRSFILLIATAFFTIATTSKLLYDKIEQANVAAFSLLEGIGINKVQAFRQTIVPQIGRFTVTSLFYAFEINVRYLSILGITLGLGFGDIIGNYLERPRDYNKAGFLVFILILLVFAIEVAAWLTKKFIFEKKDTVINLKERYSLSWIERVLKKLPKKLYQSLLAENSVMRFKFEYYLLKKKIRYNYVLEKIKNFQNKLTLMGLKAEYKEYRKYLKDNFKLEKELLKLKQGQDDKKQLLVEQLNQNNETNNVFYEQYLVDKQYLELNLISKENRFISVESMRYVDLSFIRQLNNWFYDQQAKYLTSDYVSLHKPHDWIKKTVFIGTLLILFIVLVSQIQTSTYGEDIVNKSLKDLNQIFIPSWSTFFGHQGTFGEIEYSAFELIVESVLIATMGTFFGFIIALILGALSSNVVSGKYLSKPFWLFSTLVRPTPSYIYASFLVVIVPLSPFAGVLSLTIVTAAMMSKYIRETFNGINLKVVENLRAIGLNKIQIFIFGIIPQVSSEIVSWLLYRFDVNIREVSTLGAVAAGNMGLYLNEYLNSNHFNEFATLIYSLIISCLVIEIIVSACRAKLLYDKNLKTYDWIMKKVRYFTRPKYLVAYLAKGNEDAINQTWQTLRSEYLRTIKELRAIKRTVKLSPTEKDFVLNLEQLNSNLNQVDETWVKSQISPLVKEYKLNNFIKPNEKKNVYLTNSKRFIKAYAIYYGLLEHDQLLTQDVINQVLVNESKQKSLAKNLKWQLANQ